MSFIIWWQNLWITISNFSNVSSQWKQKSKDINGVTNTYEPEEVVEEINTTLDLINTDEIE